MSPDTSVNMRMILAGHGAVDVMMAAAGLCRCRGIGMDRVGEEVSMNA